MREAFGGAFTIKLMLIFLAIYIAFIAVALNYAKAFRVKNKKTIIKLSSNTKKNIRKGIKRANYLYKNNIIKFNQYFSSIECFKNNYIFVNKDKVKHFIDRYNG